MKTKKSKVDCAACGQPVCLQHQCRECRNPLCPKFMCGREHCGKCGAAVVNCAGDALMDACNCSTTPHTYNTSGRINAPTLVHGRKVTPRVPFP